MKKGFTLVEMLIVVVIIWILAAALIPRLLWAQSQARDMVRKKNVIEIANALEVMYNEKWEYPNYINNSRYSMCWNSLTWNENLFAFISWYISNVPKDPQKNHKNYGHFAHPNDVSHCLWEYSYSVVSNSKDFVNTDIAWNWVAFLKSFVLSASMENWKAANIVEPLAPSNSNSERDFWFPWAMPKYRWESKKCSQWISIKVNASTSWACGYMNYDWSSDRSPCCETNDISRALYSYFSLN